MRIIAVFLLFLSHARAFEVQRRDDHLFLADSSCDAVSARTSDLKSWIDSTGAKNNCSVETKKSLFRCESEITNCVPAHVLKYEGKNPLVSGPNCFNAALMLKGILPSARFVGPNEIAFFMRPPLCRQVTDNEKRKSGDIGLIREDGKGKRDLEDHAFIYISEEIAYSKNGYEKTQPYELMSLEKVYRTYKVPKNESCRENQSDADGNCPRAVSFYRCSSMKDYLSNHKEIPQKLRTSFDQVEKFEGCLQRFTLQGQVLTNSMRGNLLDSAKSLLEYLGEEKAKPSNSEERDFLVGALQLRLDSIAEQLDYSVHERPLSRELRDLSDAIVRADYELAK